MVKSSSSAPYCFVSGQTEKSKAASSSKYVLTIRQQPQRAKVCGLKERDRRPIDPPPIVQIKLADPSSDRNKDYLQSPYLFMCCNLVHADDISGEIVAPAHRALAGTVVSSLNRLKDVDNSDGGFFVFGDMSVRIEGRFCLRFTLFELIEGQVVHVMTSTSNPLTVYSGKMFPGMSESTFLSRSFSDQGVRIRIRKDHHVKPKKPLPSDTVDDSSMHSPPSSCHEAEHSDNESDMQPCFKRPRPSTHSYCGDSAYASPVSRHVAIAARPTPMHSRHSPSEPMDRTPPSSPGSLASMDSQSSRHYRTSYASEEASRRPDGHSVSRQHPYYGRSHAHDHPHPHPEQMAPASAYSHGTHTHSHSHSQAQPHPYFHRDSGSPREHYSYHPSQERGHYIEGSPSHGYAPSLPMGAAHPSPRSSVHNSHHHMHERSSTASYLPPPVNAGRSGFPASLLNDHDMECSSFSAAQAVEFRVPHSTHSHSRRQDPYHSRTPSMSSQHSEDNISPPHPFSPPELQLSQVNGQQDRRGSSPHSPRSVLPLPSILPSISKPHDGEKIQLPPIHMLSTFSPTMSGHSSIDSGYPCSRP
ncbi:hypothetical protein BGZ75_004192 [Mortierella antarctica]|nr:hypothetical protein BGZ75_004192 [Mortierella antarctica]